MPSSGPRAIPLAQNRRSAELLPDLLPKTNWHKNDRSCRQVRLLLCQAEAITPGLKRLIFKGGFSKIADGTQQQPHVLQRQRDDPEDLGLGTVAQRPATNSFRSLPIASGIAIRAPGDMSWLNRMRSLRRFLMSP